MTTTTKPSEKELTDYYRKIEKALPCSAETKKKILFDLKSNIAEYLDEYPEAEMSDIINHFGTPDLFASEYVASLEDAELNKKVHKSKWIKRGVIIAVAVVVLLTAITTIWIIAENHKAADYYYQEDIIE